MTGKAPAKPRCAVLVGPYTSGKTTLLESLLFAAEAIPRKGSVDRGNSVGDGSPESRERRMSAEPNIAHGEYLGERWSFIDCPGSVELGQDSRDALMVADVGIIVAEPEPDRALTLAPILKFFQDHDIPHLLYVNKMDKANARVRDILEALQAVSNLPLVLRQVPIRDGDDVTGFVDLIGERAYRYREDKPSELIEMPDSVRDREGEARQEMLESLADFDDGLLEQLLEDKIPPSDEVYDHAAKVLREDLGVPVFLGSALHGNGVTRLWKALRHEGPEPERAAGRLGIPLGGAFTATVAKTLHQSHMGKLSIARVWHGKIAEGDTVGGERPSGLYRMMGQDTRKIAAAEAGDLVALQRMEDVRTGDLLTDAGRDGESGMRWPDVKTPVFAMAVVPENRQDEVKLTASLTKLGEEDPSLSVEHNAGTNEMLLWGQGEIQLRLAVERLKSKFNVAVKVSRPRTAYKETIRKSVTQHSRFKRQSGGHGQFGDVQVAIAPLPRGTGFRFTDKIVGGAIPKNYIPAVEHGVKEYLEHGPLGFPVVDVGVELFDGQYHSVDSSDQAFKTAGRLAMTEGMPRCDPVLLEPILLVTISVPRDFTNKIHGLVSGRRGQILGFEPKEGWDGWDEMKANMPESEIQDLVIELRSLTLGVGSFAFAFDHLRELTGKLAEKVVADREETAR